MQGTYLVLTLHMQMSSVLDTICSLGCVQLEAASKASNFVTIVLGFFSYSGKLGTSFLITHVASDQKQLLLYIASLGGLVV